ncbi:MAG: hypothetical protein KAW12_04590 [Candidatus Aminicenantes bacterium]|nr:hypothetical protein [Candidatus Aminicenantes bacterium]
MEYYLEERIGDPYLFTGRQQELEFFLKWIEDIKRRLSKSTAVMARRKMGKTALMERLFNVTFYKNNGVIPFYYEIKEGGVWMVDFCIEFFLTFIYQYMAFKTRKIEYLGSVEESSLETAKKEAAKEGLDYLIDTIESVENALEHGYYDTLWRIVRNAPKNTAYKKNEFIVQMIDEFQFLNSTVYRDKELTNLYTKMSGGYMSTAESKIAPLLVSGSWVGWLMNELRMKLPARFRFYFLGGLPVEEAVEMVFKYSRFQDIPVTEETAYLITRITEGSPFYISAIIRSIFPGKDIATTDGLVKTLEFETLNDRGEIKSTWMEYVSAAFQRVNDRYAKNIVLYLSKNKDREVTRGELLEKLKLDMNDAELETKLKALVRADIIEQGSSNFDYRGVQDNIFGKVFRAVYQKEIEHFEVRRIETEYRKTFAELKRKYRKLQGEFNYKKGYFAEYLILDQLRYRAREKNALLKSITHNLPADFEFCEYDRAWSYRYVPEYAAGFSVDIFARAVEAGNYSIVGEVKNRDKKKFSAAEVSAFENKLKKMKEIETLDRVVGFIFSREGFSEEAEELCLEKGIAYTADSRWLDT